MLFGQRRCVSLVLCKAIAYHSVSESSWWAHSILFFSSASLGIFLCWSSPVICCQATHYRWVPEKLFSQPFLSILNNLIASNKRWQFVIYPFPDCLCYTPHVLVQLSVKLVGLFCAFNLLSHLQTSPLVLWQFFPFHKEG